jgi:hypothetical protein
MTVQVLSLTFKKKAKLSASRGCVSDGSAEENVWSQTRLDEGIEK